METTHGRTARTAVDATTGSSKTALKPIVNVHRSPGAADRLYEPLSLQNVRFVPDAEVLHESRLCSGSSKNTRCPVRHFVAPSDNADAAVLNGDPYHADDVAVKGVTMSEGKVVKRRETARRTLI